MLQMMPSPGISTRCDRGAAPPGHDGRDVCPGRAGRDERRAAPPRQASRLSRIWTALALSLALAGPAGVSAARAGEPSIRLAEGTGGRVVLDVDDATLDQVIDHLGRQYGFRVERLGDAELSEPVSGHFEGPLASVLSRLLQNENHSIVTSLHAASSIARVAIYSAGTAQVAGAGSPQHGAPLSQPQGQPKPLSRAIITPQPGAGAPATKPANAASPQTRSRPVGGTAQTAAEPALKPQTTSGSPDPVLRRRGGLVN